MKSFFGEIEGTGFEILEEEFESCLTGHGRVERLWTGARWVEGPVWFPAGRFLVFSDIPNNRMLRCCLLYTSPSPRDRQKSRMPSSA